MMISNSEIREKARVALGGQIFHKNWLMSVVVTIIIGAVIGMANGISCGIASILITGPLSAGLHNVFTKLVRNGEGNEIKLEDAFSGCYSFGSNLILGVMQTLLISLWSLLCLVPGIIKSFDYSMIYFVKNDHPEYSWRECLDESERLMKGNRIQYFLLQLSFIGWNIIGTLACCIGIYWATAYQSASNAVFYEELKKNNDTYTIE